MYMKSIQSVASGIFIISTIILSIISISGVWDFSNMDVIWKSFDTLGVLAIVAILVIIATNFIDKNTDTVNTSIIPVPVFTAIRNSTLVVLIISAVVIAFLGVLSIWDVITNHTILYRSFSSLGILTFSSIVIVITSLAQEENDLWKRQKGKIVMSSLITLILFWIFLSFFLSFGLGNSY